MTPSENSFARLQAAYKLVNHGESLEYAAGVYSLPVWALEEHQAGLSGNALTDLSEIKTRSTTAPSTFAVPFGGVFEEMNLPMFEEVGDKTYAEIQARIHANSKPLGIARGESVLATLGTVGMQGKTVICRPCPYPNSGHLPVGGVQKHSAGDIFPYIIVLKGDVDHPDYHVTGNGLTIEDNVVFGLYDSAYQHAIECLKADELLARYEASHNN